MRIRHIICLGFQRWVFNRFAVVAAPFVLTIALMGTGCAKDPRWEQVRLDDPPDSYRSSMWTLRSTVQLERSADGLRCVVTGAPEPTATPYGGIMVPAPAAKGLRFDIAFTEPESILSVFVDGYNVQKKRVARWQANFGGKVLLDRRIYVFLPNEAVDVFKPVPSEGVGEIDRVHLFVSVKPGSRASFEVYGVELAK